MFKLRFLYASLTPSGRRVEITEQEYAGAHRVHLTAREGGEICLEFFRFEDLQPPEEYARHREYLARRFGPDAVTELTETRLRESPAWAYALRGNGIERAVLSLQVGHLPDHLRPARRLNDEIIETP